MKRTSGTLRTRRFDVINVPTRVQPYVYVSRAYLRAHQINVPGAQPIDVDSTCIQDVSRAYLTGCRIYVREGRTRVGTLSTTDIHLINVHGAQPIDVDSTCIQDVSRAYPKGCRIYVRKGRTRVETLSIDMPLINVDGKGFIDVN